MQFMEEVRNLQKFLHCTILGQEKYLLMVTNQREETIVAAAACHPQHFLVAILAVGSLAL